MAAGTSMIGPEVSSDRVVEAILTAQNVGGAAKQLGCRRGDLYHHFPDAVRDAQARLRKGRALRSKATLRLDETMVDALDRFAAGDRSQLVRSFLPSPSAPSAMLIDPISLSDQGKSRVVTLTLSRDVLDAIQTGAQEEWPGVLRALIQRGLRARQEEEEKPK